MPAHQATVTHQSLLSRSRLLLFAVSVSLTVSAVLSFSGRSIHAQEQEPDWILHHGKIVTVDASFSIAEAVAITDDRFTVVGTNDAILKLAGRHTKTLDLHGHTVIPGLMDNHLHNAGGGPGVDLSLARTLQEVLDAIAARVKQSKPGELIVTNADWHEAQLKEQRLPLRRDLDAVSPHHPVVVVRGGHEYILNSAALRKWHITIETPTVPGGKISRYPDGELNGELIGTARALVTLPARPTLSREEQLQQRRAEYRQLNAAGLTTVRHPGAPVEEYRLVEELKQRGLLTMRVNHLIRLRGNEGKQTASIIRSWGVGPGEGDHWLRIGGIKIGVDGGFEGAWMREPYSEPYGEGGTYYGLPLIPEEDFTTTVREIHRLGWRLATHAVGDRAIDMVLAAYEAAHRDRSLVDAHWVIEHAFFSAPDQYPRIKQLGVFLSVQNHLYVAGPSLKKYLGAERANHTTPVRTYLEAGLPVSGGSDSPVIPYSPFWVMYHFVTRDTISGGVFGPEEGVSREEALRLLTINNARLMFEEKEKGSIEPGKLADLVVVSDDILTCPPERLRATEALLTMVGGKIVYQKSGSFPVDEQPASSASLIHRES
jgi:predicted amidohydrolase YtcJ